MAYCTNCGKKISASNRFCSHCGQPVPSTAYTPSPAPAYANPHTLHEHEHRPAHEPEIICPTCRRKSDAIKRYTMFRECLFLICYIKWQLVTYTCCPDCMRKKILDEGIFTSKIITANFFWLIFIFPLAIIQLFLCGQKGHSKGVC